MQHLGRGADTQQGAKVLLHLDLSNNNIGKMLESNSTLKSIHLRECGISKGAEAIGKALVVNSTLQVLDLSYNELEPVSIAGLADGISRNQGLETLCLRKREPQDQHENISKVLDALQHNSTLLHLDLTGVHIGDDGAIRLANAFDKKSLSWKYLKISDNAPGL